MSIKNILGNPFVFAGAMGFSAALGATLKVPSPSKASNNLVLTQDKVTLSGGAAPQKIDRRPG